MTEAPEEQSSLLRARNRRRLGLILVGVGAVLLLWAALRNSRPSVAVRAPDAPTLFELTRKCPRATRAREHGRELEARARLRADRYPYDPKDGIAALHHYQEASSCYRIAGSRADVARAESFALGLAVRIQADYAAARMKLMRALQSKRWAAARTEVRQLLLLTEHLGEHDYVEWLENTMGWLTAREHVAP